MSSKKKQMGAAFLFLAVTVTAILCPTPGPLARTHLSLLQKSIGDFNLRRFNESLADGSYDGAAGILLMKPEVARSFGLKAQINENYREGRAMKTTADHLFSQAVSELKSRGKERIAGEHAAQAGKWALASKDARSAARNHFAAYRSQLTPKTDDRLNETICSALLERLLASCLKRASFNLREALGMFFNECQGLPKDTPPLTPDNVKFVNFVFSEFQKKASDQDKKRFDLGKQTTSPKILDGPSWKTAVKGRGPRFIHLVETCLENHQKPVYPVDPLLFIALIRRESNFDPMAVSYVGAAGLTQIMPKTGKGLGMKQIYMPSYFEEATSLLKRERQLRRKAVALISNPAPQTIEKDARRARGLMQASLSLSEKRSALFSRYRKELLQGKHDDRLDPSKAIAHGYAYFSKLMRMQKGDITLALAAYNAGPHRVKQYNGLPPYAETVTFRNTVVKYYREYLDRLNGLQE